MKDLQSAMHAYSKASSGSACSTASRTASQPNPPPRQRLGELGARFARGQIGIAPRQLFGSLPRGGALLVVVKGAKRILRRLPRRCPWRAICA